MVQESAPMPRRKPVRKPPRINFGALTRDALEVMAAAGREVLECHRVVAKTGGNIVGEVLRGQGTFYEWSHYPKGDVYDSETYSQYYYHAHAAGQREGEHGHFHTFLRPKGMPAGIAPAPVPDFTPPKGDNDALSHLIGVSMNRPGIAIGLFGTNRWVTGETWYKAEDVVAMLDRFEIDHARPSWPANRWIGAMIRLFRPQIVALLRQRDAAMASWQRRHPDDNAYEDRRLEVTSEMKVSVDDQIRHVTAALERFG